MSKAGTQSFSSYNAAKAFAAKKANAGYEVSIVDYFDSYVECPSRNDS